MRIPSFTTICFNISIIFLTLYYKRNGANEYDHWVQIHRLRTCCFIFWLPIVSVTTWCIEVDFLPSWWYPPCAAIKDQIWKKIVKFLQKAEPTAGIISYERKSTEHFQLLVEAIMNLNSCFEFSKYNPLSLSRVVRITNIFVRVGVCSAFHAHRAPVHLLPFLVPCTPSTSCTVLVVQKKLV